MSEDNRMQDEVAENATNNPLSQGVKNKAKKTAGKLAKKAIQAIGKAMRAAIKALISFLLPYLGIVLLVLGIATLSYFILFEFRGTEKIYTFKYENEVITDETGRMITKENMINPQNKVIKDLYTFYSGQSFLQLKGDKTGEDKKDFTTFDDEDHPEDYYKREYLYNLHPNLIFSLDEYAFRGEVRYPEQFIKPVHYDYETMKVVPLVDDEGYVVAESFEEDIETGEQTGDMLKSVRDYGFGTVLRYNVKDDYLRTLWIIGTYVQEEKWDYKNHEMFVVDIKEPFKLIMYTPDEENPKPIDIIDYALTFVGTTEFFYEYQMTEFGELIPGTAPIDIEGDAKNRYHYETIYDIDCRETKIPGYTWNVAKKLYCKTFEEKLHKYRSSDSRIYEELPVVVDTKEERIEEYYESYLYNFESYVPIDVFTDFEFDDRIDYDSYVFDADLLFEDSYGFELGSKAGSKDYEAAMQYEDIVNKYSSEFNVDKYLIIAMIAQESSGNANINKDGLMQITNSIGQSVSATNRLGETVTVKIDHSKKRDPDLNIMYGTMYIKNLLDYYGGNAYKAVQAYNLGTGNMSYIQYKYPDAWNSEFGWMYYREEAREAGKPGSVSAGKGCIDYPNQNLNPNASIYGDSCYLENVLSYYTGNGIEAGESGGLWDKIKGTVSGLGELFKQFVIEREEGVLIPKIDYTGNLAYDIPDDIMRVYKGLNNTVLFSEAIGYGDLDFFDKGFIEAVQSIGISMDAILDMAPNANGYTTPLIMDGTAVVTSKFGMRFHPVYKVNKLHAGIDIAAPRGTNVYAVADGTIIQQLKMHSTAGNWLIIDHGDGVKTGYMHLDGFNTKYKVGDSIKQGEALGFVGNTGVGTGPHLHFELIINGNHVDPEAIVLQ